MTSGLPSGLRVTDWNIAPETANAAPAAAPTSSRGSRLVHSTHSCARDPVPATTPGSSDSGMPSFPAESVTSIVTSMIASATTQTTTGRRRQRTATAGPRVRTAVTAPPAHDGPP